MQKSFLTMMLCGMALFIAAQPRLPKNYYWQKLDNCLEVVIEASRVPLATIEIAVKNGAYTTLKARNTAASPTCSSICFLKPTGIIPTRQNL